MIVGLRRLLAEIIERKVEDEPDMEAIGAPGTATTLRDAVELGAADFVIVGEGHDYGDVAGLLREHPRLRVLAVSEEDGEAILYELRPTQTRLGEASPQMIIETIRGSRGAS